MNDREQDTADRMTGGLEAQVSGLHRPPLDLAAVRARAGSIRRRRQAAVVAVVAAVVAVAVPVTASLASSQDRSQGIDPAGDPTTAVDTSRPLPFLQDDVVTLGDGRTVTIGLPADTVQQLAVLTDGRVVLAFRTQDGTDEGITVVPPAGGESLTYQVGSTLSLRSSPDRSLVAWIDADDRPQVLESGAAEPVALAPLTVGRSTSAQVVGVGGSDCAGGGCRVWAVTGTARNEVADAEGVQDVTTPAGLTLSDVYAPDGEVVLMAASEESLGGEQVPCALLLEPDGTQRARTCDTAFLRFSPDGTRLEGGSYENDVTGRVTVLDTDLRTLATIEPTGSAVSRIAWEGGRSLLAVEQSIAGNRVSWSLVHYDVDDTAGSAEPQVVAGPVPGQEFPPAFRVPD